MRRMRCSTARRPEVRHRISSMRRRQGEPVMPAAAVELLDETTPAGAAGARYRCEVDGVLVGYRLRDEAGHIVMETAWGAGAPHGLQREWDSDGSLLFEARYVKGREHGVARQWQDGRLVGTYRMSHGTGVELWRGW